MFDKKQGLRPCAMALAVALALGLTGCGGGGGNVRPSPPPPAGGGGFSGGNVNVGSGDTTVESTDVGGSTDLTKDGAGTLVLTGTNTYTGGTTIKQGTLQLGNGGTTGSIIGDVTDNGLLVFDRSDDVTFKGVVSGSGVLKQIGAGELTLMGANTYTGGTTISDGALRLGNGGTTGSITGDVTDNSSLVFDRGDQVTFSGVASGTGSLWQVGKGRMILTGNNTYTGGTTVSAGTLQIGYGGLSGSITGDVKDNGSLLFYRSDDVTFNGIVSGSGSLIQAGKSALILGGANTYSGGTTIRSGTLQLGYYGTDGSITGDVTDNGTLSFDNSADGTFNGVVSGSGSLKQEGNGTTILTGNNTYTGGTTITGGALQIGDGGTIGSIGPGTVQLFNGTLVFDHSDDVTFGDSLIGSGKEGQFGSLVQAGTGTLTLTGDNTYIGGTTIEAGTLQIGNGGTTGSISYDVADNGALVFDRSDDVIFYDTISGSGSLQQAGAGTLTLAGANTYTGGTTISAGTLQIGKGGTIGSLVGDVTDNATLAFDRSDDMNFAGLITGSGGLIKAGTGALSLTGANGYTGSTSINAGSLFVDGDQSAATGVTTVTNGATLGGKGTLGGDVTVANGGTLAPGSNGAIGTLTVNGNLDLSSGSILDYTLGQANTVGGALNDLVNVNGNLTLDGTVNVSVAPGGSFDLGSYRLFNYAGTLADNTLALGNLPSSGVQVQTGVAHQVNLLVGGPDMNFSFWDGENGPKNNNVIDAGSGTWENGNAHTDNYWTDASGTINGPFREGSFAVFEAASGTVFVDDRNGDVNVAGIQFATDGYQIQGDSINLLGSAIDPAHSIIRVGDGSSAGAGDTATIASALTGNSMLVKTDLGTLILENDNTYTGGTTIDSGTLQIGDNGPIGSIIGDVTDNGTLAIDRSSNLFYSGIIDGSGSLVQMGDGTLILIGVNTYSGGTTISRSNLQIGGGGTTGSITGNVVDNSVLIFDRGDNVTFNGVVSGSGGLLQNGTGALTLTGTNSYTSGTVVNSGSLYIDGNQSAVTDRTYVNAGTVLGGTGTIGGNVIINDGATLSPGDAGAAGTLTINGSLGLASSSILDYTLGQAGTVGGSLNDLINVNGDLSLNGTINVSVTAGGSFDPGTYRLINYAGTLAGHGLALGNLPSTSVEVQTAVAQQVNLVVSTPNVTLGFWDGDAGPKDNNAINGGSGTWESGNALTTNNWADASGAANTDFTDGSFAVFQAAPGTVTVSTGNGAVNTAGMQFAADGYVIQGDAINLVGSTNDPTRTIIRVGDGTNAGASYTASIGSVLAGNSALLKTDFGKLVLTGDNTYTGDTLINGGTLQIGSGGTTGSFSGDVVNNASLVFDRSNNLTINGTISGNGSLAQFGTGTLILDGDNTYRGGTTINAGTLQLGDGGTTGRITGDVIDNGLLAFDRSDNVTLNGSISGNGSLLQAGMGVLILTGTNIYTGGTTINSGTLQLGNGGAAGWITGDVTDSGTLVFNRSDDLTFDGDVAGSGTLVKMQGNRLILTGTNSYAGGTTVDGGILEVKSDTALGTGGVKVGQYGSYFGGEYVLQVDNGVTLSNQVVLGNFAILDNAGALGGATGNYVSGDGSGRVTVLNHDGGKIYGAEPIMLVGTNNIVDNKSGGLIQGDLVGVGMTEGGTVSNDGAGSTIRSANGVAIQITGQTGTVENTGGATISGGTTAVYLEHGGEVNNAVGSTIETTGMTSGDCGAAGDCSIYVASDASIYTTEDGGLTLTNAGTIIGNVQLVSTALNEVTLSAGGSIQGDLDIGSPGGLLTLNGDTGTTQLYSDAVTGTTTFTDNLSKSGGGTWIIDTNDLDGVTQVGIDGGVLQLGDGGTEGTISTGDVFFNDGATLVFDHSDDVTFRGIISGPSNVGQHASLVQSGSGRLILAILPSGGAGLDLNIETGQVQIGNGQYVTTFTNNLDIADNGALLFDFDGKMNFFGSVISGSGSLTKAGPGTLFLEQANTYTGGTTVENGTLQTMQALPGDVTVSPGAMLIGVSSSGPTPGLPGTAGNLANSGQVGVNGGNTMVGGNYVQASSGTLAVSLGSKLDVTGAATLNGGNLEVTGADSGYVSNTHTDVLTAGAGVNGTFDHLVKDSGVVFTSSTIHYDANSVWLDTTGLNVTTAAAGGGMNYTAASMGSAQRVQGAFEQLDDKIAANNLSGVSGDFLQAAGQFQQSPNLQAAQASLQSLSGQLHAASAAMTFEAIDASSRALSERFDNLLDKDAVVGMWMHNLNVGGGMARAGFDGVGFQLNGWLAGSDRRIGRSGVAGFAFGQSQGQQRLNQSFDHDNTRSTEGMMYAGWLNGNWYTQGRVGFGHFQQDVSRQLLLGQSAQGVWTQYNGRYNVAYGESGLRLGDGDRHLTPFVNVEYSRINRDGFAEQGAGGFGLRSTAQTLDRWQAGLGLRANRHWDLGGDRAVDLNTSAQWQRTLASHGDVFNASFVGLQQWQPLAGIGLSRYSGLFGVGLDATLSKHTTLKFNYDYEMGQHEKAQTLSAHLNVAF